MPTPVEKKDRFAYFDLLRFFGAVSIAVYHYHYYVWEPLKLKDLFLGNTLLMLISHESFLFVELFFIISGILFTVAYEQKIAQGLTFDCFFLKRMARIYPVIAVTSIYMYLGNLLLHRYNDTMWNAGTPKVMELVYDILFAGKSIFKTSSTNNGVIWFISVLMFCYVIAYILTKAAHKYHAFLIFFLPVVLGVAIRYNGISTIFFNPNTSRGLISFFIGVIVGKLFRIIGGVNERDALSKLRMIAVAVFGLTCILRLSPWYDWCVPDKFVFYGVVVFPSLLTALYDRSWLERLCGSKTVKWLGSISYGIYLWNFPICFTIYFLYVSKILRANITSYGFVTLVVVAHIVVAGLSYKFIEKPAGEWLTRLIETHLTGSCKN